MSAEAADRPPVPVAAAELAATTSGPGRGTRRASVRSLLVIIVLIPILAMVVLASASAHQSWAQRQTSEAVAGGAAELEALTVARARLTYEELSSLALLIGDELGAPAERLNELYGVDFRQQLADARAAVDADPVFQLDPALDAEREQLRSLRTEMDAGLGTSAEAAQTFIDMSARLDELWVARFDRLSQSLAAAELTEEVAIHLQEVERTHDALIAGLIRTRETVDVVRGDTSTATTRELIDADARFRTFAAAIDQGLGPAGAAAWATFRSDPAAVRFEVTTGQAITAALTGTADPAWADQDTYGDALFDAVGWTSALIEVGAASSGDLSEAGREQQAAASRDFLVGVFAAVALTAISLLAATLVARSVSRPLAAIAVHARSIRQGRLDLEPLPPQGPKELADTAEAFNEMVVALTAVEARAVAMATDPGADHLASPIPGRTGEALDRAFGLLRESIRSAEASRARLHDLATHDGMTGLLNRTAALDAVTRDLERVRRSGGRVEVLYLDLDGLKETNDTYGHDAGDELIKVTASTLQSQVRGSQVVARMGGDEFLVAGVVDADVDPDDADSGLTTFARRLADAIAGATVVVDDVHIEPRASIGLAVSEPGEATAESVIRRADAAMYRAKYGRRTSSPDADRGNVGYPRRDPGRAADARSVHLTGTGTGSGNRTGTT